MTGKLEHPGIVPIYDLGKYADGRPYYAMRFIKGESFQEAIEALHGKREEGKGKKEPGAEETKQESGAGSQEEGGGPTAWGIGQVRQTKVSRPAARIQRRQPPGTPRADFTSLEFRKLLNRFIDVCNAIEYAHSRGVIHRDIKPANIMLGKYGETLVVDWGLAKVIGRGEQHLSGDEHTLKPASGGGGTATQAGRAMGTPSYMSPEQAEGRLDAIGPPSDVYSLGATLYSLLTGKAPFAAGERWDLVSRVAAGEFPAPRQVNRYLPRALEAICLKAMALKPAARYPSARALADDIERWLADAPVIAYREPIGRRFARWVRNHKGTAGAAAAAIAVLIVGGVVASVIGRRANERTRAMGVADSLLSANAAAVPYVLKDLRSAGRLALGRLREHFNNPQLDGIQRLHAGYGLAELGGAPQNLLIAAVPTAAGTECRNLVAALEHVKASACPVIVGRAQETTDNAEKVRYAILALHLGDAKPAIDALALRSDPIHRTTFIHAYAGWHGDVGRAAELLTEQDEAAFRSGLCAALGTIASENMEPAERDAAAKIVTDLYLRDANGATHAAAGWALRQWKHDLPLIEATSRPASDRRWFVNGQGMTMVEVAAGKFTMGTDGETLFGDEKPAHEVTLTRAYYLGDREVTVEHFHRFVDDADLPVAEKPEGWQQEFGQMKQYSPTPDCPVTAVNWFDAVLYCNWLSKREAWSPCYERTGEKEKLKDYHNKEQEYDIWRCHFAADGYRLPTEAEWEFAARAGSTGGFCYGSDEDLMPQYAWFVVNAKSREWPGGAKLPNALGLFDLHGNVFEWCWDWMGNFSGEPVIDPTGPIAGSGRVSRGGTFASRASVCQSAGRGASPPVYRLIVNGFRVLCGR